MNAFRKLNVMYVGYGEHFLLGTLAQLDQRLVFEYSAAAVAWAREHHIEFSALHAPVPKSSGQSAAISGTHFFQGLPGFIADAMPDGWGMLLMDRALRQSGRDPRSVGVLDRLAMVGDAAMGALCFAPADPLQVHLPDALQLKHIAAQAQAVLNDDAAQEGQQQLLRLWQLGGSPQGARPKALLRRSPDASTWHPDAQGLQAGEPWLIKFPAQHEHAEVCAMEELYARLARKGGIEMPPSAFFPLDRVGKAAGAAFGVRRFDRVTAGAQEHRVPLQSMAAFLHADYRLPALDYETVMQATWRMTADVREVEKAFSRCVFNVLTHNRDDHAKNFAFVMNAQGQWKLSPAFDLTFSYGPGGEHSTSVAGEGRLPTREHLLRVAHKGNLKTAQAQRVIDHWLDILQTPDVDLMKDLPIRAQTLKDMKAALSPVFAAVKRNFV